MQKILLNYRMTTDLTNELEAREVLRLFRNGGTDIKRIDQQKKKLASDKKKKQKSEKTTQKLMEVPEVVTEFMRS